MPPFRLIRPMRSDDLPAVLTIERRCHAFPWSEEIFVGELAADHARIDLMEIDGEVAGFLCWWLVADEIEIQDVATAPAWRRRGVARDLLAYVLNEGRDLEATRVLLEVRVGNAGAIALYRTFGFTPCGNRRCYYPDGEDALLMACDLSSSHSG